MMTNTEKFPRNLQRILAIRLDNIGDVVMMGPALRALRVAFPSAEITLMASPAGSQVGPLLPWLNAVIPWRAVWQDISPQVVIDPEKEYRLVAMLKEGQYDAVFIFTSFSQSPHPPAYVCYLARIPLRVGQTKEFGGGLLTHWVKSLPDTAHQVERNLHLLRSVGLPDQGTHLELHVPPEHQQRADEILRTAGIAAGEPYIVLAPGASCPARRYADQRFAQASEQISAASKLPIMLLGSQREAGTFPALENLAARHSGVISLIGQTTVPEMGAIIQHSRLVIANNSGAMHFAAAFRRPMVILFSGTELLEQWVPNTPGARFLFRPVSCSPCHGFQCPYQMECLDIPLQEVTQHALDLLREYSSFISIAQPSQSSPEVINGRK